MRPELSRTLGLVFFPAYDWGICEDHPEREERLLYTQDQFREEGLLDLPGISEYRPLLAGMEDISRTHFCPPGFESQVETPHLASAGSAITAGRLVLDGRCDKAFALTRPPGHHAMKIVQGGRGFCAVNIEAVMIDRLRRDFGVRRVAVVDTDCHHGDGTQDIYWHDPDTLFISIHQDGRTLYPGTGFPGELGGPRARGSTINIPLPPNTGDEGFLYAMNAVVRPILEQWKPELLVNSAGQDNHFTDPITNMRLSARGYARMVAALDPQIAVLEGGYSIQGALPYVNLAVALALAGMDYSHVVEPLWKEELCATDAKSMNYIRSLSETVLGMFARPEAVKHDYTHANGQWTCERDVYYDTDGIRERRHETLTDCSHCRGLLRIRSRTDLRPWSLCVEIPAGACPACRSRGHDAFTAARKQGMRVELRDVDEDLYQRA
ncbi:histone deacetylase [Desulfovibrio sp. OttesenSCG-928-A18]|nr:histone deacetylase [Desulfovibrio sp. OttesenSCG-928-A18]